MFDRQNINVWEFANRKVDGVLMAIGLTITLIPVYFYFSEAYGLGKFLIINALASLILTISLFQMFH